MGVHKETSYTFWSTSHHHHQPKQQRLRQAAPAAAVAASETVATAVPCCSLLDQKPEGIMEHKIQRPGSCYGLGDDPGETRRSQQHPPPMVRTMGLPMVIILALFFFLTIDRSEGLQVGKWT